MIIIDISHAFGFQQRKLDEEVHASILLGDKFLIPSGIENLRLERDNTNHVAVQDLHGKVLWVKDIAVIFRLSVREVVPVPCLMLIRIRVYFSEAEYSTCIRSSPVGCLGQDLKREVENSKVKQVSLNQFDDFPSLILL